MPVHADAKSVKECYKEAILMSSPSPSTSDTTASTQDSAVLATIEDLRLMPWFQYLHPYQQDLLTTAVQLLRRAEVERDTEIRDFGYVVFSASKAYEGFLKQYFIDLQLLPRHQVEDRYFRIGRSLNPDVKHSQRDEDWVFDNLQQRCGKTLARELWNTWLECRNHVFHYFPHKHKVTELSQARRNLQRVIQSIQTAVLCQGDELELSERTPAE